MEELIAKRYIKAMKQGSTLESMQSIALVFSTLAESFKNEKFLNIVNNPDVAKQEKMEILISAVKPAGLNSVENLIKLLVENNRISIIPAIAEVIRKDIALTSKNYSGIVYSDSEIDASVIKDLSVGLGKKFDSVISLKFVKDNFDGVKVNVEDLGVEISFSKTRINNQIVEHIIKAI